MADQVNLAAQQTILEITVIWVVQTLRHTAATAALRVRVDQVISLIGVIVGQPADIRQDIVAARV